MAKPETGRDNPELLEDDRLPGIPARPEVDALVSESRQVSERTNVHDEGSDANDTMDGLTESEEAVRHAAEDIPTGQDPAGKTDAVPVFDRGGLPPTI